MKWTVKSKTFWLNAVVLLSAIFALPELTAVLGEGALQYVVIVQSALNLVLRWIGGAPLTLSKATADNTGDGK